MEQKQHNFFPYYLLLSSIGGFLDIYTYMCRDGVFANAQTGNIVLLGLNILHGDIHSIIHYLFPILAFSLGVFIALYAIHFHITYSYHIVLLLEILIVGIVLVIPTTSLGNLVTTTAISFVCALQVQTFKNLSGKQVATTMCTGNLRNAIEHAFLAIFYKDQNACKTSIQYLCLILAFIIGVILGGLLCNYFGHFSLLYVIVILFILCITLPKT